MNLYRTFSWSDPFQEMRRFQQDIDHAFGILNGRQTRDFPPVNLWAGEEGVVVSSELPGIDPEAVQITVHKNTVTLSGQRLATPEGTEATPLRRELATGSFSRTITLPFVVDAELVNARSQDGVLVIYLPRPEADRPKQIRIATA